MGKWDKVGQKSAFFIMVATINVTFVKDQGVKHMFTPSLQVYHICQEVFLFFLELPRSLDRGSWLTEAALAAEKSLCQDILVVLPRGVAAEAALPWATFISPLRGQNRRRVRGSLSGSRGCNPRIIVPNTVASRQRRLRSLLLPFRGAGCCWCGET